MSASDLPVGEGNVPDKVLEELLAAFAADAPLNAVDVEDDLSGALDDPSIDLLLGLGPEPTVAPGLAADVSSAAPSSADVSADLVTEPVEQIGPAAAASPNPPNDAAAVTTAPTPQVQSTAISSPTTATAAPINAVSTSSLAMPIVPSAVGDDEQLPTELLAAVAEPAADKPARKPIQIGANDDFVDPVYLDEEGGERLRGAARSTEASIERTPILIGGDEIEGSSGGIPVATGASMDPRLRARRIAVRRAVGRRRLKWFLIVAAVVLVVTGALALLGSSMFAVRSIRVSGAHQMSPDDLLAAENQMQGHPVLLVDTHQIEQQLKRSPWVRDARVSTHFPHSASIEIVERQPLATYVGGDGQWRIIDDQGVVLVVLANRPLEFMPISGNGPAADVGGYAGDAFKHGAELVEALSSAVRVRTAQVDVSDTGELSLEFHDNGTIVILGAPEQLLDKLTRLETILQRGDAATLKRIDVSTANATTK